MLLVNLLGAFHQLGVFGRESLELSSQLVSAFLDGCELCLKAVKLAVNLCDLICILGLHNSLYISCLTMRYRSAIITSHFGARKLIRKNLQYIKHFIFNWLYILLEHIFSNKLTF